MSAHCRALRALTCLFATLFVVATACSQTSIWIGPESGNWSDAANWSTGVVPDGTTDPNSLVIIDSSSTQDSSIVVDGDFTVGSILIDPGDTLSVAGENLFRTNTTLNQGTIELLTNDVDQGSWLLEGNLVNAPGAHLKLDGGRLFAIISQIRVPALVNDSIVEGRGKLETIGIENHRLIDANANGEELIIQGKAGFRGGLTNLDTLRASNGGTLRFTNWFGGIHQNPTGVIEAQGDSIVLFDGTSVTGGRITTSTTGGSVPGRIHANGVVFDQVRLEADVHVTRSIGFGPGSFENTQTIYNNGNWITVSGDSTLAGGGVVELGHEARIRPQSSHLSTGPARFVNLDNTIRVNEFEFAIIDNDDEMVVDNHGVFEATGQLARLTFELGRGGFSIPSAVRFNNTGIVRASDGGIIDLRASRSLTFDNTGGIIEIDEFSRLETEGNVSLRGGTIRGPAGPPQIETNFIPFGAVENVRLEGHLIIEQGLNLFGTLENAGVLQIKKELLINSETTKLTGGGTINLDRGITNGDFRVVETFINVDNTLILDEEFSFLGFNNINFYNQGTIEALGGDTETQLVTRSFSEDREYRNSGLLQARGGATLHITGLSSSSPASPLINYDFSDGSLVPGTILAGPGSEVRVERIIGGILKSEGDGVIRVVDGARLHSGDAPLDMHLMGRIETENLLVAGTIRNDATLVTNGSFGLVSHFGRPPSFQLLGSGQLELNGTFGVGSNSVVQHGPEHTILLNGAIDSAGGFFINEGRIEVGNADELIISQTGPSFLFQQRGELVSSGDALLQLDAKSYWTNQGQLESRDNARFEITFEQQLTNAGTIRVGSGATIKFEGDLTAPNDQIINALGAMLDIDGEAFLLNADIVNEVGGVVRGDGILNMGGLVTDPAQLINRGTIAPGNSIGPLTIGGDLRLAPTSLVEIELGGTLAQEEHDVLQAISATIGGHLQVVLADLGEGAFSPALGDTFTIVETIADFGPLVGQFDTYQLPTLGSDLAWQANYQTNSVELEVVPALLTDFDNDGDVDGIDFSLLQTIDPSMLPQWQAEYGRQVIISSAEVQAVPEPATLVGFAFHIGLLLLVRRVG